MYNKTQKIHVLWLLEFRRTRSLKLKVHENSTFIEEAHKAAQPLDLIACLGLWCAASVGVPGHCCAPGGKSRKAQGVRSLLRHEKQLCCASTMRKVVGHAYFETQNYDRGFLVGRNLQRTHPMLEKTYKGLNVLIEPTSSKGHISESVTVSCFQLCTTKRILVTLCEKRPRNVDC